MNKNKHLVTDFFSLNIGHVIGKFKSRSEDYWRVKGEEAALKLFHDVSQSVPAYQDFLKRHRIDPEQIKTIDDFKQLPVIDKKNYISQYSLEQLSWGGKLSDHRLVSCSSGTSGSPSFWPRGLEQDLEGAFFHEHLLVSTFGIDRYSTLVVLCFALGSYVAGTYTLSSLYFLSQKGYSMMIVTPGIQYGDAIKMIKHLAPSFDQIILCGYPPAIKDLVDLGAKGGISWKQLRVRFLFSAETFSETWRDHLLASVGSSDVLGATSNIYGSADTTLLGFETPLSIAIRRAVMQREEYATKLFGSIVSPTLVQYDPTRRYFESIRRELIVSLRSGIPLVRYNLHDRGDIVSIEKIHQLVSKRRMTLDQEVTQAGYGNALTNLPFLFILGRTDGAISFYGVLIFPEFIKSALEKKEISRVVSGKFTMCVTQNTIHNPLLEIHLELRKGVSPSIKKKLITNIITQELRHHSGEYDKLSQSIGKRAGPHIVLHKFGDPSYFQVGTKQQWIKK